MTDTSTAALLPEDEQAADLAALGLAEQAEGLSADESKSPFRLALRRFARNPRAMIALILLAVIMFCCLFPSIPARFGPNDRLPIGPTVKANAAPSHEAWFGTDNLTRDLYSRIWYGGQVSMLIGLSVAAVSCTIGTLVGAIAGYLGGLVDDILMRLTDLFLAFPVLVLLLVMRNVLTEVPLVESIVGDKGSPRFVVLMIAMLTWMPVARIVRGEVLSLKEREFVEAAQALGAGSKRIIFRHLLPNALGPIIVALTLAVIVAILAESTLSYFGYGPQRGDGAATWGLLIAEAPESLRPGYWWKVIYPSAALVLTILCINFVGDGLRDAFDPKARKERV